MVDLPEHGRVERVEEVGDVGAPPVDSQSVLREVVGAYRYEVDVRKEDVDGDGPPGSRP